MPSDKSLFGNKGDGFRRKNTKDLLSKYFTNGAKYKLDGKLDEALDEYEKYAELCKDSSGHDRLELAKVYREMGEIKVEMKDYDGGLRNIKTYLQMSENLRDVLEEQRALTTLGRSYYIYAQETENEKERNRRLMTAESYCQKVYNEHDHTCFSMMLRIFCAEYETLL